MKIIRLKIDIDTMRRVSPGQPSSAGDFILERRLRLLMKYVPDLNTIDSILDYGCGNGVQTALIAPHVRSIDAIDISTESIEHAKSNCADYHDTRFHIYDGTKLPFDDSIFDLVYSFEVLEHTIDDRKSIEEICRVLKPGGIFFFTVPNRWWIFETHGANLPLLKWNRVPFFSYLPKKLHDKWARARIYSKGDIIRLLSDSALHINTLSYVTAPMDALHFKPIRNFLRSTIFRTDETIFPFLSTAILCVCLKIRVLENKSR